MAKLTVLLTSTETGCGSGDRSDLMENNTSRVQKSLVTKDLVKWLLFFAPTLLPDSTYTGWRSLKMKVLKLSYSFWS